MTSYVWLKAADGTIQQVEEEVAMFCPVICHEILEKGMGTSKTNAVVLSDQINPVTLSLILDYCRFHQDPRHSFKERKAFDDKFIQSDTKKLCKLMSAAASLQLVPLVDLIGGIIARIFEGKTQEEIRTIFHFPDDLLEEKLEPPKKVTDDPRIRLLNRLYERKRKEMKERFVKEIIEVEEEPVDNRSVDDLLSFINGGGKECKAGKTKKKNRKKKSHTKVSINEIEKQKEGNGLSLSCKNGKSGLNSEFPDPTSPFSHKLEFDDDYTDDDLDPVMKEEIDREVEEFARRLNSVWPERVQQLRSSGPERRLTSIAMSGKGSTQRCNSRCLPDLVEWSLAAGLSMFSSVYRLAILVSWSYDQWVRLLWCRREISTDGGLHRLAYHPFYLRPFRKCVSTPCYCNPAACMYQWSMDVSCDGEAGAVARYPISVLLLFMLSLVVLCFVFLLINVQCNISRIAHGIAKAIA